MSRVVRKVLVLLATPCAVACGFVVPDVGGARDGGSETDPQVDGATRGDAASDAPTGGEGGPELDASNPVDAAPPQTWTVNVGGGGSSFTPSAVTIKVGDTVHWVWLSGGHTVTSGASCTPDNVFCAPSNTSCASAQTMSSGTTYDHRFDQPGVFPYFCRPHCGNGMKGTITVQ